MPTEFAAAFNAATGVRRGPIITGAGKQIDVSEQFEAMRVGDTYLALHTHPSGTPFSLLDVKTFLENPVVSVMAVVTLDGRWFVMSRERDVPVRADRDSLLLIAQTYTQLRPRYKEAADTGAATEHQALAGLLHHVWRVVAERLGVRYDWTG